LIEKYISDLNFSLIKPTNATYQIHANSQETTQTHFGEIIPSSGGYNVSMLKPTANGIYVVS